MRSAHDGHDVLREDAFARMIAIERKRTDRSANPFLLMLLEAGDPERDELAAGILTKALSALVTSTRETDIVGWQKDNRCLGVVFTQLDTVDHKSLADTMLDRVTGILRNTLTPEQFTQIKISFHVYPERWDPTASSRAGDPTLYPDLRRDTRVD